MPTTHDDARILARMDEQPVPTQDEMSEYYAMAMRSE